MSRALQVLLFGLVTPAFALAQTGAGKGTRCAYDFASQRLQSFKQPSGQYNVFAGGNVVATCRAKGSVVTADSLEYYGDEERTLLIGHATYKEPRLQLKSDVLTYFETDERILASQNVDARLPSGSTIRGPQLEFLRAVPRVRPLQQATATGRPTISLVEKDAKGRPQPPVRVTGNTVWLVGDSVVMSEGSVVVVRPQLTASGDSLYGDSGLGLLRLMQSPKIVGTKGRPFTLTGGTIDLLTRNRKLEQVLAKSNAQAQSEELHLKSDTIDMRVTDDLLQRAIVWGKSRAMATSPTQSVVADSIDVLLPGQRVRELHALRGAVAQGMPDTTRFVTKDLDRLTGDTIVARFDSIPALDTVTKPTISELLAIGNATSLRQVPAQDTTVCVPMIVYTRGRIIDVSFKAGLVDSFTVKDRIGLANGLQLEPKADSTNKCSALRPHVAPAAGAGVATPATPAPGRPAPTTNPVALPSAPLPSRKRP